MSRTRPWEVSDALWGKVKPLIPPAPSQSTSHGETRSPFLIPDTTDASVTSVTTDASVTKCITVLTRILWCTILLGESCRIPVDGMRRRS